MLELSSTSNHMKVVWRTVLSEENYVASTYIRRTHLILRVSESFHLSRSACNFAILYAHDLFNEHSFGVEYQNECVLSRVLYIST